MGHKHVSIISRHLLRVPLFLEMEYMIISDIIRASPCPL